MRVWYAVLAAVLVHMVVAACRDVHESGSVNERPSALASPTGVPDQLTPGTVLRNASGVAIPLTELKFLFSANLEHDELATGYSRRVLVGLHANNAYYYVWLQKGQYNTYDLYCHGNLRNAAGVDVPVNSLKFALEADLDRDKHSEIVGLQSGTSWMYAWPLSLCNDGAQTSSPTTPPTPFYAPLYPALGPRNLNGYIKNASQSLIPVDQLKHVFAGHFSGAGRSDAPPDQIRALHANNAYSYIWSLHPDNQVDNWVWLLASHGYLKNTNNVDVPVNNMRYVFANRTDPSNSNWGGSRHELVSVVDDPTNPNDGSVVYWEDQPTAVREAPLCKNSASTCANRALVFSLDQGAINGIVANSHRPQFNDAFNRIVAVLLRFRSHPYQVYALVNPDIKNKTRLISVLDRLRDAGIPFLFEAYASDVNSLCTAQPGFTNCFATFSGQASGPGWISIQRHPTGSVTDPDYIDYYISHYGNFAGIRIFEILSQHWTDWTNANCLGTPPATWAYSKSLMQELVQFAASRNKFVFLTDNKWHNPYQRYWLPCDTSAPISAFRADVIDTAALFPNRIYLGFSNNEGVRDHVNAYIPQGVYGYYPHNYRLENWQTRLVGIGNLLGTALSNQSWIVDGHRMLFEQTLPPEEFAIWVSDAFHKGARLVQLEPNYYMFKWDRLTWKNQPDAMDLSTTSWDEAGAPTDEMMVFAELLGVDLSGI